MKARLVLRLGGVLLAGLFFAGCGSSTGKNPASTPGGGGGGGGGGNPPTFTNPQQENQPGGLTPEPNTLTSVVTAVKPRPNPLAGQDNDVILHGRFLDTQGSVIPNPSRRFNIRWEVTLSNSSTPTIINSELVPQGAEVNEVLQIPDGITVTSVTAIFQEGGNTLFTQVLGSASAVNVFVRGFN